MGVVVHFHVRSNTINTQSDPDVYLEFNVYRAARNLVDHVDSGPADGPDGNPFDSLVRAVYDAAGVALGAIGFVHEVADVHDSAVDSA